MKADATGFLKFISQSPQFTIPVYQRAYSWTKKECGQLWDDIMRSGSSDDIMRHFIGSVVYIEELAPVSNRAPLEVIDGQQRLTSISLLLAALVLAVEEDEPFDGFSAEKLRNYYLLNQNETGDRHYRLLLSQSDRKTWISIINGQVLPDEPSFLIVQNFKFFQTRIASLKPDLAVLCKGLLKLGIVDITLNRNEDDPQLIFESMNSTGCELSQADLIRNFILMKLPREFQEHLYNTYWQPIEQIFGQEQYNRQFDAFMRHYLTMKTHDTPKLDRIYETFKQYFLKYSGSNKTIEDLVSEIRDCSRYYSAISMDSEQDPDLKAAFADLQALKSHPAYPFLLRLYSCYAKDLLSKEDFIGIIRLIESYIFRRSVCGIPSNSMNETFSKFEKSVDSGNYYESIKTHFMNLRLRQQFPRDHEFVNHFKIRNMFSITSRGYWLRRLENFDRKEQVPVHEYTIEHIMPQNENLPEHWRRMLGSDWKEIHENWLHRPGNLTLTGYNSEYADKPFEEKRDMKGGFRESPLRVNEGICNVEAWTSEAMEKRGNRLATLAMKVWPQPDVPQSALEVYDTAPHAGKNYTIENHPELHSGDIHDLYTALREQILTLHPEVTEVFLKNYVTYKKQTNFANIKPMKGYLGIMLNMPFTGIHDPEGICEDVSGKGTWGNGEVRFRFEHLSDLNYVMKLVTQSFERQVGL